MPFVEIQKLRTNPISRSITRPHMSVIVSKSTQVQVYFRLPHDLVNSVWHDKLVNDDKSVRLGILEGTETDAGFIMLVHKPLGYTFSRSAFAKTDLTPSASAFTGKVSLDTFKNYVPKVLPQPPVELEFSIDGPAILLQMPDWFVYTPKVVHRATMVPTVKQATGRPSAALNSEQRRLLR